MKEIYKDIEGYEGHYQVSNLGNVKSFKNNKERILKPGIDTDGYKIVGLCKNGKQKTFKVHKLVAMTFLGHKRQGLNEVVDHIDNVKTNNRLDNLQLISHRENTSKDRKGGTSEYVGVCWDKSKNKWRSEIRIKGKSIFLGLFDDEYDAHLAYQKALKEIKEYEN